MNNDSPLIDYLLQQIAYWSLYASGRAEFLAKEEHPGLRIQYVSAASKVEAYTDALKAAQRTS